MSRPLVLPGLVPPTFARPAVDAHHSPDLSRRYAITVRWGDDADPLLHWQMLNPSIAGLEETPDNLDPTLRRVRGFTAAAGYTGFRVFNLSSRVSTDPAGLAVEDPADLSHEGLVLDLLAGVPRLVCAWGAHPWAPLRAKAWSAHWHGELLCLGTSKAGAPVHPLYQPAAAVLRPWDPLGYEVPLHRGRRAGGSQ